jgi:Zn-dependent protease
MHNTIFLFSETRHKVYNSNPEDLSSNREENGNAQEIDYAHPEYYQSPSAQPVPLDDSYSVYSNNFPDSYRDGYSGNQAIPASPYASVPVQEYRNPQDVYTSPEGTEQQQANEDENTHSTRPKKKLAGLSGILVAIGSFLLKFKSLAFLLKFGLVGFSALASVFVYSLLFGWQFAIGLVILLFIHEMGHAVVMKFKGVPMGGMIFVPLLGAAVTMRQMPQNAKDEAEIGIAGPIAGAIAAGVCFFFAKQFPDTLWAPLAYFGFFLNLFNLVPIVPFDGGRVVAAIDRRVWIIGFIALLGYQIWEWMHGDFSPWLFLFVIMAATQLWSRGLRSRSPQAPGYYKVQLSSRILLGILYFGLIIVLFLGMTLSHNLISV